MRGRAELDVCSEKLKEARKDQARTWRLIRVRGNENGQKSLFQEGAVLEQYIPFGDDLGDARGHQYGSAT